MRTLKERTYTGTTDRAPRPYESAHRALAKEAAAEGIVLLRNENNLLPLSTDRPVALFGAGASHTVKGGTGSGDVNERESVSIYEGLINSGFSLANDAWIANYETGYASLRSTWKDAVIKRTSELGEFNFFEAYNETPFVLPVGIPEFDTCDSAADTAIYVLSRQAGEGADRFARPGDYYLSEQEEQFLAALNRRFENIILIVNAGGPVDLSFLPDPIPEDCKEEGHTVSFDHIRSVLWIVQPGMEGGNAVADILSGKITPSGKLTDSLAYRYSDYPSSDEFSHNNGNLLKAYYEDGLFVGYRFFDSFRVPLRYSFGYGMSYTTFAIETVGIRRVDPPRVVGEAYGPHVAVEVVVTNTGSRYSGKEVVELYISCPRNKVAKEFRRLVAFGKTKCLAPGEKYHMFLDIAPAALTRYDPERPGWVLDEGSYILWAGNSLAAGVPVACIVSDETILLEETENILPLRESLACIQPDEKPLRKLFEDALETLLQKETPLNVLTFKANDFLPRRVSYAVSTDGTCHEGTVRIDPEALEIASKLSVDECVRMVIGDPAKSHQEIVGNAGMSVPGAAGETGQAASAFGVASLVLADGPAGLRLQKNYDVADGTIIRKSFMASVENGMFADYCDKDRPAAENTETYYQYCTAFPVGTLLAQTWNVPLITEIGRAVGEEMDLFQVTLWLAPGMNIHRNPLCGRNFEYYSEDPFLTGTVAAAITNGVQSIDGVGTTIKHFACNNCEDNRTNCDSVVDERTLREIYLKGFEIAVRTSHPLSIMTSYNLINGVHTANSYDLCTRVARCEWGFGGMIMTDWMTTMDRPFDDPLTPAASDTGICIKAGNDLVMPGGQWDFDKINAALTNGTLTEPELRLSTARIIDLVFRSRAYRK